MRIDALIHCLRARAFRSAFSRRLPAEVMGVPVFVATVADTVITKLEWASASRSTRQRSDIEGMLTVHAGALDIAYVEHWVRALGLVAIWTEWFGPAVP